MKLFFLRKRNILLLSTTVFIILILFYYFLSKLVIIQTWYEQLALIDPDLFEIDKNTYYIDLPSNTVKRVSLIKEIKSIGNIPLDFLNDIVKDKADLLPFVKNCGQRPTFMDIEFSNTNWQSMQTIFGDRKRTRVFLYGAYLDTRPEKSVVRVLAVSYYYLNVSEIRQTKYCQFWYNGAEDPTVSRVEVVQLWPNRWGFKGHYHPYFLSCQVPRFTNSTNGSGIMEGEIPSSVSIVGEMCKKATNDIKITYKVPKTKEEFGVCVKGLNIPFEDLSLRFIEWIEIIGILGAKTIHFHLFHVHPNILKVLKYYEAKGQVTLKPFSLPGFQPNLATMRNMYIYNRAKLQVKRRQELIAYNDCFYTNMYSYKYIVMIDYDEIILSRELAVWTWTDLIQTLNKSKDASQCFEMMLFVDKIIESEINSSIAVAPSRKNNIDGYPFMMNKLSYDLDNICNPEPRRGVKCFQNTKNVLTVHNHKPLSCLEKPCYEAVNRTRHAFNRSSKLMKQPSSNYRKMDL